MMLWWLTGCLGSFLQSAPEDVGPYALELPNDLQPVELGSEVRDRMFVGRFRRTSGGPDQQVVVTRPIAVPDSWVDGGLPTAVQETRTALMPIRYAPTQWLDGPASLGEMPSLDGMRVLFFAAVRDGWLHELQCTVDAGQDAAGCIAIAASARLTHTPVPPAPLPSELSPHTALGMTVPVPEGWTRTSATPELPEQVVYAAPPAPTDDLAGRALANLRVEIYPDMQKLGAWVQALRPAYEQGGMRLLTQDYTKVPLGDAVRSEYTDGVSSTLTVDIRSTAGMIHAACTGPTAQRPELGVLCSQIFEGLTLTP